MSEELRKKAIEMLLKGGTLVSEPCPYCQGVRVIKNGDALCVNCGKEPDKNLEKKIQDKKEQNLDYKEKEQSLDDLKEKLVNLSQKLENEKNPEKQQKLIKSINSLVEIIAKLKT